MANHTIVASIAPNTVPDHIGQEYYNSVSGVWYKAIGISSVADWITTPLTETLDLGATGAAQAEFALDISTWQEWEILVARKGTATGAAQQEICAQYKNSGAFVTTGYYNLEIFAGSTAGTVGSPNTSGMVVAEVSSECLSAIGNASFSKIGGAIVSVFQCFSRKNGGLNYLYKGGGESPAMSPDRVRMAITGGSNFPPGTTATLRKLR